MTGSQNVLHELLNGRYMNNAEHKLIIGKHHSLLVTQRGKFPGVLMLSDVFEKITDALKECRHFYILF
jgi:hypothetical protein